MSAKLDVSEQVVVLEVSRYVPSALRDSNTPKLLEILLPATPMYEAIFQRPIYDWCQEHGIKVRIIVEEPLRPTAHHYLQKQTIYLDFDSEQDLLLFKLRWL